MGLLSKGTPLPWKDSLKHQAYVRKHGITQFLNIYNAMKDRTNDIFLWGDEVESLLVVVDGETKSVKLALRGAQILETLEKHMKALENNQWNAHFLPEYGCFMIEATPGAPYGGYTADLRLVEANMKLRRQMIESMLQPNERLMTITTFPLLGVNGFTSPLYHPLGSVANSDFLPDEIISPHPRFATLTRNIRTRRGSRVKITVPLFQDTNTVEGVRKLLQKEEKRDGDAQSDPSRVAERGNIDETKEIYMDAMGFGMGACCLQVTFQARNIGEARHLYDHLAVLAPIMLALTAATPFQRGHIADIDVRWTVISQSVDDRTPEERGEQPFPSDPSQPPSSNIARPLQRLHKSRYDSISTYISLEKDFHEKYNDLPLAMDDETYAELTSNGVDTLLARHIAHLWTRDPLVIYDEHIALDDTKCSDHFENIQSTNWQTVRFKPPTPGSTIGWRVEFRSMEVQLTDFENAAFTVFIALISRAVLYFDLNFYIPITKSDENLKTAHKRNALLCEKFYWRKQTKKCISTDAKQDEYELQSIKDIICGTPDHPGLIDLVKTYLDMIQCDKATRDQVECYLELIGKRAKGELMCLASWLRKYVSLHPSYQQDSILPEDLVYDMLETLNAIAHGQVEVPQLLGKLCNSTSTTSPTTTTADDRGAPLSSINLLDFTNAEGCSKFRAALSAHWSKPTSSSTATTSTSSNNDCGCG